MNQESTAAQATGIDIGQLIMDRTEYLAMRDFGELFGESLSAPILYDPR